ncbi:putative ABC exporter domain-containing protein [Clostridium cylindrosporum]|uniref:ABC exporter n=1 Tax=Clostridium cylindrosporum DSM 605 TaxID=1121307 RepID=A0A0J8DEA5_CLOCY|nr:putative ABC exporter domain-containing protein [Clostridium cylindrosporum]KMT22554.1 hypothetical protein CLCY_10c01010 [Clostridium cylindrosporum DSM 605]
MKSLGYLLITTMKNFIKDLKNNPAKIVVYIVFILLLGSVIFSRNSVTTGKNFRDISELYAIIFALYASVFLLGCLKGFSSGASFFSMADVNILFSTPISSKKILVYGLFKQIGTSLLVGFFLLFQYGWLNASYNVSIGELVIILLGYGMVMLSSQVTSMAIYSYTSGDESRKRILKSIIISLCILVSVYILLPLIANRGNIIGSAVTSINSSVLNFIPIIGWVKYAVVGVLTMNYASLLLGVVATIVYIALILVAIVKSRSNYYEDVLKATEVSFSAITAKKEGKAGQAIPMNVKVGKTGIGKGIGADVFFHKHMIENRRSKVFVLDLTSLLMILFCIVFAVILGKENIGGIFSFATYMQIFTVSLGRWGRELISPYVYMIPVDPFKKLIMICLESVYKMSAEAILLFVPIGMIIHLSFGEIIICIIARIGFGILLMAGTILQQRVFGSILNKIIIFMLYIVVMIILSLPGIVLGYFIGSMIKFIPIVFSILIGTVISNLLISLIILYTCRNILNYAELNNR